MNKENIKELIQKAEESVYGIEIITATNVELELITAIEYMIQAFKSLKELEE